MGWRRKQKNRTENGPRWEGTNAGEGCNSTHVARARKWWKRYSNRTLRRTGKVGPNYQSMSQTSSKSPESTTEKAYYLTI